MTKTAGNGPEWPDARRSLRHLLSVIGGGTSIPERRVSGIQEHSAAVAPGEVFVAIRGTTRDGHDYLDEAVSRGASALVVENAAIADFPVPVVRVADSRKALATLAAAWHGHPGEALTLVGITGTLGKTSVLAMLEAILIADGMAVGTIGSLGVRSQGLPVGETGHTAPDPRTLHRQLASLRDAGSRLVAMEVTSHALSQKRVHGLRFQVGIFTNLLPLEHREYHASFAEYVAAKAGFLEHLRPGAPVVYNADDLAVSNLLDGRDCVRVSCGVGAGADVQMKAIHIDADGTRFTLALSRDLHGGREGQAAAGDIELQLRLLGGPSAYNACLAATAALILGAQPDAIHRALMDFPPPRRRMEITYRGAFRVLDDTLGHPESVTALFEVVEALRPARVHAVCAIRGARGVEINTQIAESFATWAARVPLCSFIVTRSEDTADERNRVTEKEAEAFASTLREASISFEESSRLGEAIQTTLSRVRAGDLVLLLGAQGMDAGADLLKARIARRV